MPGASAVDMAEPSTYIIVESAVPPAVTAMERHAPSNEAESAELAITPVLSESVPELKL